MPDGSRLQVHILLARIFRFRDAQACQTLQRVEPRAQRVVGQSLTPAELDVVFGDRFGHVRPGPYARSILRQVVGEDAVEGEVEAPGAPGCVGVFDRIQNGISRSVPNRAFSSPAEPFLRRQV